MGADFIGWRGCPLQASLGQQGFHQKLKLRAYKTVIDAHTPDGKPKAGVQVVVNGDVRELAYENICEQLGTFERGVPECQSCPIGGGEPLGCYRYVSYPVDAYAEQMLMAFFIEGLTQGDRTCQVLDQAVVQQMPREGTPFHTHRGADPMAGHLAESKLMVWEKDGKYVDSAQLLRALVLSLDRSDFVLLYAAFLTRFLEWVDKRALEDAPTDLDKYESSRTLRELRALRQMLAGTVRGGEQLGWTVFVDG
jgi:hypothetical protein